MPRAQVSQAWALGPYPAAGASGRARVWHEVQMTGAGQELADNRSLRELLRKEGVPFHNHSPDLPRAEVNLPEEAEHLKGTRRHVS